MTVLIVGADRLGKIPDELQKDGFTKIIHWTGRERSFRNRTIPKKVDRVLLFYDFTNHCLMHSIKRQAKNFGIPIIYTKRSVIAANG